MASIHDVAKRAAVSPTTISRFYSNPKLLNESTRHRVVEAVRALRYTPRQYSGRTTVADRAYDNCIGFQFFCAEQSDSLASNFFYADVLSGAQREAEKLGYHLLVNSTDRHALSVELPQMVRDQRVGGMLLVGTADQRVLDAFENTVPHIVLVDNRDPQNRYESVVSDGLSGTYQIAKYLIEMGHRKIAFAVMERGVMSFEDRLHGYYAALIDSGIPIDKDQVLVGKNISEIESMARELVSGPNCPTAIVAGNDVQAFGILRAVRDSGKSCPQDVSVVGFDDVHFSHLSSPPLTTVSVDRELMGQIAVRRLWAKMRPEAARDVDLAICNLVSVSLVKRDSCRPIQL